MTTRPEVNAKDFERVMKEIVNAGHQDKWFSEHGLSEEIEEMLIEFGKDGFPKLMAEAMFVDHGLTRADLFGSICATFLVSGFILGWECQEQCGGERVRLEGDDEAHFTDHV